MKNTKIKICDTVVHPGEMANLALPLPELYSFSPQFMPIKVIHGKQKGPCIVIFSILNGTELNGLDIVNRLTSSITPKELSGTIIAIPVVNVYGLTHYPLPLPTGNKLSDCFPGNEEGTFGERMAYLLTNEILKKADYCIELQTGGLNHNILPQVYCNFSHKKSKDIAKAFDAPVITNVEIEGNSLRQTAEELQLPLLVYQAGEAMRFDENAIDLGFKGVKNVMCELKMLNEEPYDIADPIFSRDEDWILAHKGGIFHTKISLGQSINEKEILGEITDPFGADVVEHIKSSVDGIVVGINTSPLVHEGLPLIKIASFLNQEKAESAIEDWDQKQPDSFIS